VPLDRHRTNPPAPTLTSYARALGTPEELKAGLEPGAILEEVFRTYTGDQLDEPGDSFRDARRTRRTASRLG
jgi:ABC-2 type transport system ATP-binding protein